MIASGFVMLIAVAGAVVAVGVKNIVHAIFGLGVSLAGLALAFLLLGSPFVAAMQVLIYIGGITIAMVFAVMLSSMGRHEVRDGLRKHLVAAIVSALLFVALAVLVVNADLGGAHQAATASTDDAWSVQAMGRHLLNHFNVAFELLSVVLLVAIVGAITIAGRHGENLDPVFEEECES